jgi:predicted O-methyltransferase YrrM
MSYLDHPWAQQNRGELQWLHSQAVGCRSILEIGSCYGHSLRILASALGVGSLVRSIDMEVVPGTSDKMRALMRELTLQGLDADYRCGDSKSEMSVAWAWQWAPYDLVFIDGDHDYEGVKADWERYGCMGRMVAFHDIAHPDHEVKRLWAEIKAAGCATDERVESGMGIGLVRHEAMAKARAG